MSPVEQDISRVFDWVTSHWAFVAFVIGMIFEVPALKLRPFTRILNWLGKRMHKDIDTRLDKIDSEISSLKTNVAAVKADNEEQLRMIDMNDANVIRTTILDFANSLRRGVEHTQEDFSHIFELNDKYKEYMVKYKFNNGKFENALKFIIRKYDDCMENNSFVG